MLKRPAHTALWGHRATGHNAHPFANPAAAGTSNPPRIEVATPRLPPLPSLTTPMPQQTYSQNARLNINAWQKKLTGTQLMRQH